MLKKLKTPAIIIGGLLVFALVLVALYAQFMTGKVMTLQAQNELASRQYQAQMMAQQQQENRNA